MAERWWKDVESDPVHEQAAEWVARLENPQVSLDETLAWQQWMQENRRHALAFERMEALGRSLRDLPRPDTSGSLQPQPRRAARFALAASMAAVAVAALWLLSSSGALEGWFPRAGLVQTAVGENRSLRLEDGSRVTLGGGTQLHVRFDDKSRHFDLSRGEAFFVVAQDPARPFTVNAGEATVRAVGTEFNVRRGRDRVVVAVVEGRVMIEPQTQPANPAAQNPPLRLDAGQQTTIDDTGMQTAVALADPDTVTTWRSGRLTFRGEPLRHVVEDVNRYAAKPVIIDNAEIGELRFTGTVLNDNVPGWIASLESVFGVRAVEEPERIVLRLP